MRSAQPDRRGEHQHVHHQIQRGRHIHQRRECGVAIGNQHEQQRQNGHDDALRNQNALLHAMGVALLQRGRHKTGPRGRQKTAGRPCDPRHHGGERAQRDEQRDHRSAPAHAEVVEELFERQIDAVDEPQLTMRHGEGDGQSRQHEHQQDQCGGQCDGARELAPRMLHVIGVHGVDLHARIGEHIGDDQHDRRDARPRRQQRGRMQGGMHRFADSQPDRSEDDEQQRREQRSDKPRNRTDLGEQIASPQRHQRARPIQHDDHRGDIHAVIAQAAHAEHVRQADGDEGDLNRIPHHVLDPLQPDGKESDSIAEGLTHPYVHAALPAGGQFGCDQGGRHQKDHRGNEIQQDRCETVIGHGRQRTQRGHRHHGQHGQLADRHHDLAGFACGIRDRAARVIHPGMRRYVRSIGISGIGRSAGGCDGGWAVRRSDRCRPGFRPEASGPWMCSCACVVCHHGKRLFHMNCHCSQLS